MSAAEQGGGWIQLTASMNGVRMSYVAAMLASEAIETNLLTTGVGAGAVYRLMVRVEDGVSARATLRALQLPSA